MINQKESKQIRMNSMGNITPTMDHYPRKG